MKSDKEITENDFVSSCEIKKSLNGFKLLNKGELKSKINLSISKATKSSIELIENLGGTVNILETPKEKETEKLLKNLSRIMLLLKKMKLLRMNLMKIQNQKQKKITILRIRKEHKWHLLLNS